MFFSLKYLRIYTSKYLPTMMYFLFFIFNLVSFSAFAAKIADTSQVEEPPKIGNFALPNTQQPGTIAGLGENILDKGETQLFLLVDNIKGVKQHYIDVYPGILYGIDDKLSIFLNVPFAASYRVDQYTSKGIEDIYLQLEYAYYQGSTKTYTDQATIVGTVSAPTGSIKKNPTTGYGSPTYILGTTWNRTYMDWVVYGSPNVQLTTAKNGTKYGNSYNYQFGFGKRIANVNCWLLNLLLEFNGTYWPRDRVQGVIDPDSGGNVIYAFPSIWASTKNFLLQFGVGYAAQQHLFGDQPRQTFFIVANFGWSFY